MSPKKSNLTVNRNVALCYVRKSWTNKDKDADDQDDKNLDQISPERQRAHIQAVCDANGWKPEWYEDIDGHRSGMHEKNRPGWLALKARLRDPDVVALVANDLARLHRKGWRIGDLLDFVDQHDIKLVLADPRRQIDFSTPYGRMFAQLSAIFDEWYALDVSERWKADIAHRKAQGKTVGLPPFGTKRNKEGYLIPSEEGAWLLPDGTWIAGKVGEAPPVEEAVWRGYYECAERILRFYGEKWAGRTKISERLQAEGWAWRDRDGNPRPFEAEDVRRVTNNWPEYGGIVIGKRARERSPLDYDPEAITLNPERAVFDIEMLMKVGRVQKERTHRAPDRGHAQSDYPYPLSGLTYCAHCERIAQEMNNPKLRSRLGGKTKRRYRHKAGGSCGCTRKSVLRDVYEADFFRLIQLLMVRPEMVSLMEQLARQANIINPKGDKDFEDKKATAIAKCHRRIEAARHLYEDGDISRQEYVRRREQNEQEIVHWQTYTTETQKLSVELAMCIDVVEKIVRLWESSDDEDRQGMARHLFEYIVYDLDKQQIVDFRLKPWANRFLILRGALYQGEGENGQAASGIVEGTKGALSPVGDTRRSSSSS
jgi:DNA invertase Pin-like site-specific DNA recombinase